MGWSGAIRSSTIAWARGEAEVKSDGKGKSKGKGEMQGLLDSLRSLGMTAVRVTAWAKGLILEL